MFLKGECADFPDSWSDRVMGADDLPNQRTQYELRRAAVRICEACPAGVECLAFGIMVRDQYGIYGGLPLRPTPVLKTAQEAGFRSDPDDPTAERRLARFIRANPVVAAARERERECKRRKTEQRNAPQQRWRATTRSTDRQGEGPAAAATHPRFGTPSSEDNPIQITGPAPWDEPFRKPVYAANRGTVPVDTGSRKTE
jgi:WhiB family redox-sensing transcriptional regulator